MGPGETEIMIPIGQFLYINMPFSQESIAFYLF